jgi:hypothetical protein
MGLFDRRRNSPIHRRSDGTFTVDLDPQVRELVGSFGSSEFDFPTRASPPRHWSTNSDS